MSVRTRMYFMMGQTTDDENLRHLAPIHVKKRKFVRRPPAGWEVSSDASDGSDDNEEDWLKSGISCMTYMSGCCKAGPHFSPTLNGFR